MDGAIGLTMSKIIKVIFLLKKDSPRNLETMTYFVNAQNYVTADELAKEQLRLDVIPLAKRFSESVENILRYYDNMVMGEVDLINQDK